MKDMIFDLFDYQKFSGNVKLAMLIRQTESRYFLNSAALGDDELDQLAAAGEAGFGSDLTVD